KQLTNLCEGEAMELRLLDKAQTFEDLHRVNAKSTGRAWSSRDDAELFVVAQRIRRQSTARGEFSDRERLFTGHQPPPHRHRPAFPVGPPAPIQPGSPRLSHRRGSMYRADFGARMRSARRRCVPESV